MFDVPAAWKGRRVLLRQLRAKFTPLPADAERRVVAADEHWLAVMKENLNPKILDVNLRAFDKGKELTKVLA